MASCLCASASRYRVTAGEIHDYVRWKCAELANSENQDVLTYEVLSGSVRPSRDARRVPQSL